jgi:hypothetical protein
MTCQAKTSVADWAIIAMLRNATRRFNWLWPGSDESIVLSIL